MRLRRAVGGGARIRGVLRFARDRPEPADVGVSTRSAARGPVAQTDGAAASFCEAAAPRSSKIGE
jgi:hypothetical protein